MIGNIDKVIDLGEKVSQRNNELDFLKKVVANYYGLNSELDLLSKSRERFYLTPRHNAMYLMSTLYRVTSIEIGKIFNCDHATVLHAIGKVKDYLTWDEELRKEIKDLEQVIKLKSLANQSKFDISKEFYFVDLNNFISIKGPGKRAIILSGFSKEEVENMRFVDKNKTDWFIGHREMVEHKSTGLYILEKKNEQQKTKR